MAVRQGKEESASQGKYVIVPGTRLDDPWWQDPDVLHVEPLREDWRAEDQLLVPMAPGFFQLANIMYYRGDFSPQDEVRGVSIANGNPQTIPAPAIDIGIAPYWGGFGEGLRMTLPDSGLGDGLHIKGSRVRTACIRVPADMPALRFDAEGGRSLADIPYVEGNTRANAFEFNSARGGRTNTILSVTPDSLRLGNDTAVKGSARTRGKAVFSGDGKTRTFTVRFSVPFAEDAPCIVFTDNQFARSRLANTTRTAFSVEFDDAPPEGKTNVLINWMAQE